VFRIGGDPVAAGLVTRLNQPGGNVTGATTLGVELGPKRLQMLREMLPARATVALFSNPAMPMLLPKQEKSRPQPMCWTFVCWC
jgi:putative ABC transport system substrate-binding protein